MEVILNKDFKTNVLKMFKGLMENVKKVKKICEQNGNINKATENLKETRKKSGAEKYNKSNENFTRGIKRQT